MVTFIHDSTAVDALLLMAHTYLRSGSLLSPPARQRKLSQKQSVRQTSMRARLSWSATLGWKHTSRMAIP